MAFTGMMKTDLNDRILLRMVLRLDRKKLVKDYYDGKSQDVDSRFHKKKLVFIDHEVIITTSFL